MKKWFTKQTITMFILGIIISSTSFVVAEKTLNINKNPFPIIKEGEEVKVDGYNIDGSTYLKLREISTLVDTKIEFNQTDKKIYIGNKSTQENYNQTKYLDKFPAIKYGNKTFLYLGSELQDNLKIKKYKLEYNSVDKNVILVDENQNILVTIDLFDTAQTLKYNGKDYINYELIKNYMSII